MLGVFFTLCAAVSFGINNASVRRGVIKSTVTQIVAVSMPIGLVTFALTATAFGQIGEVARFSTTSLAFLASAGVIHFVLGRYCGYRSIQAMGAVLASPVQQWSLLVTLTLAVVYLHETLDLLKIIGIALMVLGPSIIVWMRRMRTASKEAKAPLTAKKFTPKIAEGYFFGILCCLCWGSSPILVRAGLEGNGHALAGGVVSYSAAMVAVLVILMFPLARRDAAGINRSNLKGFFWIGFTVCLSQIFVYLAVAIAPVTIVQPLMRFSIIFSTLISWFMNRDYEVFDPGVLVALGASVVGALALSLDPAMVMRWIGASPGVTALFTWSWPGP